jgi:hypothetical protein
LNEDGASLQDIEDYVRMTARFLALPLDSERVQRVAAHLARTRKMAAGLLATPLDPELEPAEIYSPAPFPPGDE